MDQNLISAQPVQLEQAQQNAGYGDFLLEVKTQIRKQQYQALRAANKEMLSLYWWIGESIHFKQIEQGWGKSVVESLANDLQIEFPGRNGFSARSLWSMLNFYTLYEGKPKLLTLLAEVSWAKNVLIMDGRAFHVCGQPVSARSGRQGLLYRLAFVSPPPALLGGD